MKCKIYLYSDSGDYILGAVGAEACPAGYSNITSTAMCEVASAAFDLSYQPRHNDGNAAGVCFWCRDCCARSSKVASDYSAGDILICRASKDKILKH